MISGLLLGLFMLGVPKDAEAGEYKQIIQDEGVIYQVYRGPKGFLHAGVGHKLPDDCVCKVGDEVDVETVARWFWQDYEEAEYIAHKFAPNAPKPVHEILTNMAFNLGEPNLFKFVRLRKAIEEEKWSEAAYEMQESQWFLDVGPRAKRLIDRMLSYGRVQRSESE